MRNDAVVVPLRRQAPANASGDLEGIPRETDPAAASGSADNPLAGIDPDLADNAAAGAALTRGKGEEKKRKGPAGKLEKGDAPPAQVAQGEYSEQRGVVGVPIAEAFGNASANGTWSDALGSQVGKGKVSEKVFPLQSMWSLADWLLCTFDVLQEMYSGVPH